MKNFKLKHFIIVFLFVQSFKMYSQNLPIIGFGDQANYRIDYFTVPGSSGLDLHWYGGIRFGDYTSNSVMQIASGKVGIGTNTPQSKLHSYANLQADIVNINNASAYLQGQDVGVIFGQYNVIGGYGSWVQSIRGTDETPFSMSLNPIGGNVGIGATSPNSTLQIGDSNNSGNPSTEVEIKRLSLAPVTHSGSDWFFTTRDNNPFANLDIGYSNNKTVTIRHDGNVGIGSTNPDSKLTVAGNINSREVKVTVDAGADFVFEHDYNLPSLDSVDKFIKENKHLPEIASAKEMQKDGINLSEMNIKLLQKVEELTLYIIEQQKR